MGILDKVSSAIDRLRGIKELPKSVRNMLDQHGNDRINFIMLYRAPLDNVSKGFLNAITLGKWDEIRQKGGVDKLFHTYMYINGTHRIEKNETISYKRETPMPSEGVDFMYLSGVYHKNITIAELFSNGEKYMGKDKFLSYDGFNNNCQDFLMGLLKGSNLDTPEATKFLKQDVKKLVENTPAYSKLLGGVATDIAGKASEAFQEIRYKKGGRIFGNSSFNHRRMFL